MKIRKPIQNLSPRLRLTTSVPLSSRLGRRVYRTHTQAILCTCCEASQTKMAASIRMCTQLGKNVFTGQNLIQQGFLCSRSRWQWLSSAANGAQSQQSDTSEQTPDESAVLVESLTKEKEEITLKLEEITDKYKRSLAETENVRQRLQKQISDAKLFGIQGFCKDLLEVADILNKATESVPKDELTANIHLKDLFDGLTMTETQLQKVFKRNGLDVIEPAEGEKFDPNFHEALFEQPVPGKEPGTVAVVTKLGYSLHGRTLRPALVGVFKAIS